MGEIADGQKALNIQLRALLVSMKRGGPSRVVNPPLLPHPSSASAGARAPTEARSETVPRSGASPHVASSHGGGEISVAFSSSATSFGSRVSPRNSPAAGSRRSRE
jgi:hypothetical protein